MPTRKPAAPKKKPASSPASKLIDKSSAQLIDQRIRELDDWRGATLARTRALMPEFQRGPLVGIPAGEPPVALPDPRVRPFPARLEVVDAARA